MLARRFLPVALVALLAGCVGGAHEAPHVLPDVGDPLASGALTFTIAVPGRGTAAGRRVPAYVSGSTTQARVAVTTATGNAIPPVVVPCTTVCTGTIRVPPGPAYLDLTLQDAAGRALSHGTAVEFVVADQTQVAHLTLDGVVASVVAQVVGSYVAGTPGDVTLYVDALDADGNVITGDGGWVDAGGAPVLVRPAATDATLGSALARYTLSAPAAPIPLHYDGHVPSGGPYTISPTIAAGAVTSSTAATIAVAPAYGAAVAPPTGKTAVAVSADGSQVAASDGTVFAANGATIGVASLLAGGQMSAIPWRQPLSSDGTTYVFGFYAGAFDPSTGMYMRSPAPAAPALCMLEGFGNYPYYATFADTNASADYCWLGSTGPHGGWTIGTANRVSVPLPTSYADVQGIFVNGSWSAGGGPFALTQGKIVPLGAPDAAPGDDVIGTPSSCHGDQLDEIDRTTKTLLTQRLTGNQAAGAPVSAGPLPAGVTAPAGSALLAEVATPASATARARCTLVGFGNGAFFAIDLEGGYPPQRGALPGGDPLAVAVRGGTVYAIGSDGSQRPVDY